MNAAARTASIAGTRQMVAEDEFTALVTVLVDCKAVPGNVMASVLDRLADKLIAKARGQMESDYQIFPSEIFSRVRQLSDHAAHLRGVEETAQ